MIFKGKKVIDITLDIKSDMPVYPGDPKPFIEQICSIQEDGFALSAISVGSHTGTHVDAPSHIIEGGMSVDMLPPKNFIGRAILIDITHIDSPIRDEHLDIVWNRFGTEKEIEILLLKTGAINSVKFADNFCLNEEIALWIYKKGIKTIGIDAFSIENMVGLPLHRKLLSSDVNIIECLNFKEVKEGIYTFICLPLKITGCDGAPARAILIEE
jgi:arylformamidase